MNSTGRLVLQSKIVFWDKSPFPANQTSLNALDSDKLIIDAYSRLPLKEPPEILHGVTSEGEHLDAFALRLHRSECQNVKRNFDIANSVIRDKTESFECYHSTFLITDFLLGDARIDTPNPMISSVEIESSFLHLLLGSLHIKGNDPFRNTLFSNEILSIELTRSVNESYDLHADNRTKVYSIIFKFNHDIKYIDAINDWVEPIINLINVLCGGIIPIEDHQILSRNLGAAFRGSKVWDINGPGSEPNHQTSVLSESLDLNIDFQKLISEWMERPNSLRGISPELVATRYGDVYAHSKLICATRGIEAMYADLEIKKQLATECIEGQPNGRFDLSSPKYSTINRTLKSLEKRPNFRVKLAPSINRFKSLFEAQGNDIDWDGFITDAKNYRNSKAHGTTVGGAHEDIDKLMLTVQLCFHLYSLAVISLGCMAIPKRPFLSETSYLMNCLSKVWSK